MNDRAAERKAANMLETARKRNRRRELLAVDPHCCECGRRVQDRDGNAPDAAALVEGMLACRECQLMIHRVSEFYAAGGWKD